MARFVEPFWAVRGGGSMAWKHGQISTLDHRDGFRGLGKERSVALRGFRPRIFGQGLSPITRRVGEAGGLQQRWRQVELADHAIDFCFDAAGRARARRLPEQRHSEPIAIRPVIPSARWTAGRRRVGSDPGHEQSSGWFLVAEGLDQGIQCVLDPGGRPCLPLHLLRACARV